MATQPPLGAQPAGLLDLLRIRNGGQYPQRLDQNLVPTVELLDHYMQTNALLRTIPAPLVFTTLPADVATILDAESYWRRINWIGLEVSILGVATDSVRGQICMAQPGPVLTYVPLPIMSAPSIMQHASGYWQGQHFAVIGKAAGPVKANVTVGPVWLPPGWDISLYLDEPTNTSGLSNIVWGMSVTDMKG